jgi:hypothetical protein
MLLDMAVQDQGGTAEAMNQLAAEGALERQALSEAVQVFAGMAVESAVNLLGVMAIGEDQFLRRVERRPVRDKLSTLLRVIGGKSPLDDDELLVVVERLRPSQAARRSSPPFDSPTPRRPQKRT